MIESRCHRVSYHPLSLSVGEEGVGCVCNWGVFNTSFLGENYFVLLLKSFPVQYIVMHINLIEKYIKI